ncbi:hypothetical protein GCM10017779_45370 [Streptomyces capillispiralis]|nr:hypothetical protein GCM10017779_45370 [Streptomyces capillispiralis]
MSTAVDKQHALTVTAEVHTGQDTVLDGNLDLCSGHHRTLSARRRRGQLLFSQEGVLHEAVGAPDGRFTTRL